MTGETSTQQSCPRCGAGFPAWSMFCTQCGAQTEDSRPGSRAASAMAAPAPAYQPAGNRIVRTQSNTHGTYAIVWSALGFFFCLLFWFPAFSQAKKSRLRGEAIATTASNITMIGLIVWVVLQVASFMFFFWLASKDPAQAPTVTSLAPIG